MRKNAEFYTGESTPFLSKHRCSTSTYSMSAKTYNKYYVPLKNVQIGELAVAFCGASSVFGVVKATKQKGRKTYVAFENKPNKLYLISKCVALPVVNEFVRHKQNKRWFKVIAVTEVGTLKTVAVLNMPEENVADKSADAADKSADATDKSENAADKSADATDKSADAAADKSADADTAAEKSDKSDTAAEKSDKSADFGLRGRGCGYSGAAAGRDIANKKKEAEARKKAKKSFGAADEYGEVL